MSELQRVFRDIYQNHSWRSPESVSGGGSELGRTEEIRAQLPALLAELGVRSILDAGCGDWNWMSRLDFGEVVVLACDIVPELVQGNAKRYGDKAKFLQADIVADQLPTVDLIMCRATLFHLSNEHAQTAIQNMTAAARYLLLTTHFHEARNKDIRDGEWRRLNLMIEPFLLPAPERWFYDGPGQDGALALWPAHVVILERGSPCGS